jgi:hypothetical protein
LSSREGPSASLLIHCQKALLCKSFSGARLEISIELTSCEDWSAAELEDEIKEHVYRYERHMRASRISGVKEALEIMLTGVASLPKICHQAAAWENFQARGGCPQSLRCLLREESTAPGRELDTRGEADLSGRSQQA